MKHDRNCASRWTVSAECDCGADRVNSEEAIHTLESVNRALESRVAELEAFIQRIGNCAQRELCAECAEELDRLYPTTNH